MQTHSRGQGGGLDGGYIQSLDDSTQHDSTQKVIAVNAHRQRHSLTSHEAVDEVHMKLC